MFNQLDNDDIFGSFGGVFGRDFMNMDSMFDKMLQDQSQGQIENGNGSGKLPGGGVMHAQSYCFSQSMGGDGKPQTQKYFVSKSRGLGQDNEQIGEIQEMYHNSATQKKVMAQERTLDGKGVRMVKSKHGDCKFPNFVYIYF